MRFTYLALALLALVVVVKAAPIGPKPLPPADISGGTGPDELGMPDAPGPAEQSVPDGGPDEQGMSDGGRDDGPDEQGMPDDAPSDGTYEASNDTTDRKGEENPQPIEELRPEDGGAPEANQYLGENTMAPAPEGEDSYVDQPQEPEKGPQVTTYQSPTKVPRKKTVKTKKNHKSPAKKLKQKMRPVIIKKKIDKRPLVVKKTSNKKLVVAPSNFANRNSFKKVQNNKDSNNTKNNIRNNLASKSLQLTVKTAPLTSNNYLTIKDGSKVNGITLGSNVSAQNTVNAAVNNIGGPQSRQY